MKVTITTRPAIKGAKIRMYQTYNPETSDIILKIVLPFEELAFLSAPAKNLLDLAVKDGRLHTILRALASMMEEMEEKGYGQESNRESNYDDLHSNVGIPSNSNCGIPISKFTHDSD